MTRTDWLLLAIAVLCFLFIGLAMLIASYYSVTQSML